MDFKRIKYELQHILSGESSNSYDALIQAVASHIRSGSKTGPMAQEKHKNKNKETEKLIDFARVNNLWIEEVDENSYISSGAEQRVYIRNEETVIKLNDAIYYASWEDYFHNLLLHNYFFADTAYDFIGFYKNSNNLYAVVKQPYIKSDRVTNMNFVREFMAANGFVNTKNYDYFNPKLGIIIEDLHDENVLTNKDVLYFIDTVFYIEPAIFWINE